MIEIITGSDRDKRKKHVDASTEKFIKAGYVPIRLSCADMSDDIMIVNELLGNDLFATKKVYILSDILEALQTVEVLEAWDATLHPDVRIIWHEDTLPAVLVKKMEKKGHVVTKYTKISPKDNSIFALTDVYARRDVKATWLQYRELLDNGMSPHQMIGMLWWQMKTLLLIQKSGDTNPGLAPFVYTKNKKLLSLYSEHDLENKALGILDLYHRGHMGDDIEVLLEQHLLHK